jgi:uroporphyrinogen-III synthase
VNFPSFTQGDIKFVAYGKSIVSAMENAGLHPDVKAPTPQMPSVALALAAFLSNDKS